MSPYWGDWSNDTVRLDIDNTSLSIVKFWAFMVCKYHHQNGFVILESSSREHLIRIRHKLVHGYISRNFSVIFNRRVRWETNVKIMDWVARLSNIEPLKNYVLMQGLKTTSTVRCLSKGKKPPPRVVFGYGKQDGQVKEYLETQKSRV